MNTRSERVGLRVLATVIVFVFLAPAESAGQAYRAPRTPDGHPDLSGIWQAVNTAEWNLEDHHGALGEPPGLSVVEGGTIPYLPEALKKREENFANRMTADPDVKCFYPGVPRSMYKSFPFQILQAPQHVMISSEYGRSGRTIYLDPKQPGIDDIETWMGLSRGRWDGETLVIETANFNDQTWFDRSGNYHSEALKVVERITRMGPDHLSYEATIEDPKVFSRPWKITMPLYRRLEKGLRLLEYECTQYLQDDKWKTGLVD